MPLKKGRSEKTVSQNIGTLLHEYDREGHIGTSEPATRAKAQKQAIAIALNKAGRSRRKRATRKSPKARS